MPRRAVNRDWSLLRSAVPVQPPSVICHESWWARPLCQMDRQVFSQALKARMKELDDARPVYRELVDEADRC